MKYIFVNLLIFLLCLDLYADLPDYQIVLDEIKHKKENRIKSKEKKSFDFSDSRIFSDKETILADEIPEEQYNIEDKSWKEDEESTNFFSEQEDEKNTIVNSQPRVLSEASAQQMKSNTVTQDMSLNNQQEKKYLCEVTNSPKISYSRTSTSTNSHSVEKTFTDYQEEIMDNEQLPDYQIILQDIKEKNKKINRTNQKIYTEDNSKRLKITTQTQQRPSEKIQKFEKVISENREEMKPITNNHAQTVVSPFSNIKEDISTPHQNNITTKQIYTSNIISDKTEKNANKTEINFWQLLQATMQKSASLLLKKHDIKVTQANLEILKNEYYPHLALDYTHEYYHGFSRSGESANIGGSVYPDISEYRNDLNLNFNYEIYRFGATDLKIEMADDDIKIIKSELGLEKEKISKELLQYYTNALKAQENIFFKEKIIALKQKILNNYKRLFKIGKVSQVDITTKEMELTTLKKEVAENRLILYESIQNIEILSNVKLDLFSIVFAPLKPKKIKPMAFNESSTAKNIKFQIEKKLKEIELLQKDYYPTLLANGEYRMYGADRTSAADALSELKRNNWRVGLLLKWDIFNGYQSNNSIKKAKAEIEKLVDQYRFAKINYEAQEQKRNIYNTSIDTVLEENRHLIEQMRKQERLLQRLEEAGKVSSIQIDLLKIKNLQQELEFKINMIDKLYKIVLGELTI